MGARMRGKSRICNLCALVLLIMPYLPLKLPGDKYMQTFNERSTKVFVWVFS